MTLETFRKAQEIEYRLSVFGRMKQLLTGETPNPMAAIQTLGEIGTTTKAFDLNDNDIKSFIKSMIAIIDGRIENAEKQLAAL